MLRGDLIDKVSQKTKGNIRINKEEIGVVVDAVFESIKEGIFEDGIVKVQNFGNFEVRERAARKGTHPQTNAPIQIPAHKTVFLNLSKKVKNELNNK